MSDSTLSAPPRSSRERTNVSSSSTFAKKFDLIFQIGIPTAFVVVVLGYPLWNLAQEFMPRVPSMIGVIFMGIVAGGAMLLQYFYGPFQSMIARGLQAGLLFCGVPLILFSGSADGVYAVKGNLERIESASDEIDRLRSAGSSTANTRALDRQMLEANAAALRGMMVITEYRREIGRIRVAVYHYAIGNALLKLQPNVSDNELRSQFSLARSEMYKALEGTVSEEYIDDFVACYLASDDAKFSHRQVLWQDSFKDCYGEFPEFVGDA